MAKAIKFNMTPAGHGLGWVKDLPDHRDYIFAPKAVLKVPAKVPAKVDLRAKCPPVYDQGQLGSCTANALGAAFDFDRKKAGHNFLTPSRLFIYWNERDLEHTTQSDAGAQIRDGVKVLVRLGTPPESQWPYIISKFRDKPTPQSYTAAAKNQALEYSRILVPARDPLDDMLACLAGGLPFVAGILLYESFESPVASKTGVIHMPTQHEDIIGGHAVLIVGYNHPKQQFIFRNSWGTGWGDKGYGYLPFDYLTNAELASDMWVIRTVET